MNAFLRPVVLLLATLAVAGPAPAQFDAPPTLDKPQAGFYRLTLGKVDVIAVNDGAAPFDVLGVVTPTRTSDAAKIMAKSLVTSPVQASVNAYVILIGNKTILVDAGTGELVRTIPAASPLEARRYFRT